VIFTIIFLQKFSHKHAKLIMKLSRQWSPAVVQWSTTASATFTSESRGKPHESLVASGAASSWNCSCAPGKVPLRTCLNMHGHVWTHMGMSELF